MGVPKLLFVLQDMYRQAALHYEAHRVASRALRALHLADGADRERRLVKWRDDPMGVSDASRKRRAERSREQAEYETGYTNDGRTPANEDPVTGCITIERDPQPSVSLH